MHSSALRALECIGWGRGATGHSDTSAAETGAAETSEREKENCLFLLLARFARHFSFVLMHSSALRALECIGARFNK